MKTDKSTVDNNKTVDQHGETGFTPDEHALLAHHGMDGLLRLGLHAAHERTVKNRIILVLVILSTVLGVAVFGLSTRTIEPRLLSETADGRIRPIPLLEEPIYTQNEIITWADKCVRKIYDLSYVNWRDHVYNETMCLSDKARQGFVSSLQDIGVMAYLDPKEQGIVYAVPGKPVLRASLADGRQYAQWIVDVPYTLHVEGRRPGRLNAIMSMKIIRVPMSMRADGIWVESYQVKQAGR